MNEPLDFSSLGSKKQVPPPKPESSRRPPRLGRPKALTAAIVVGAVALVAGVGYVVSSRGDSTDDVPAAVANARYCELSLQFHATASATGAFVSPTKLDGPPDAIARLEAQMSPVLGEFESTAPKNVRPDVKAVVGALRKAGSGDLQAARSDRVSAAIKKMRAFEDASCAVGSSSGDG